MSSSRAAPSPGAPSSSAHPRDGFDPQRVLADRVEQLYSQMPLSMLATLAIGGIATYELWDERTRDLVLFWWGLVLLVTAARAVLYFGYRASTRKLGEGAQWLRWLAISALANGVIWGFAGAVFFPSHTDEQQVFLAFLLAGITSAGIPAYAASWPMFAVYAAAIVLPFTYVLASFGNRLFAEIALLVPLFYLANVGIAYRLNRVFLSGYRLRHAYDRLTDDYTRLNRQLEQQIEDLLEARQEVEASGRKLALFAERAPIAVFEMDANSTILEINPAAEDLLGYPALELIGRSALHALFPTDEATFNAQWWARFIADKQPANRIRARCLRRDGLELVCEFTLTPLINDAGDLVSTIAQCQDITQQLEAERLKKEFTSTLSHELRTPLTSIIGSLQLVNSGVIGEVTGEVSELTLVAERNAQRLFDLINDLLDIDKIESGKFTLFPEEVSIGELVQESLILNKSFADRYRVALVVRGELSPARVRADRKRLMQVMTNLLSNAVKFSPEGAAVEIGASSAEGMVRVEISDRGSGIPEDFHHRMFTRFAQADSTATRNKGGTGLGLAICRRLVELMDGRIGFENRSGGGTIFHFELPMPVPAPAR
ncbi:MAG TPA: HAMP domain-containing sensor histidine kinase [Burkholderiales bacterium]|nr:HAMP domain-containing sensor histidine kinase [Burkholderiales bacterium]